MKPLALAGGLAAVHLALGLAVLRHPGPFGVDRTAFDAVDDLRSRTGLDVVRVLTDLGALPVVALGVVAGALVAYRQDRPVVALALIAGFVLVVAATAGLKELWDRPRPVGGLDRVRSLSFPSGHSSQAMAWLAAAHVTRSRALLVAAGVLVAAIGLSRLYLHVHYLTDVLGGVALAGAVFAVALRRA